jgi:hypothetical protein
MKTLKIARPKPTKAQSAASKIVHHHHHKL